MTSQRRLLVLLMTALMLGTGFAGCLGGDDGADEPDSNADNGDDTGEDTTFSDADGDGILNLAEYSFGTNPRVGNSSKSPITSVIEIDGQRFLAITYQKNANADDIVIDVQSSEDFMQWTNEEDLVTVSERLNAEENTITLTRRMTWPLQEKHATFLRVCITF